MAMKFTGKVVKVKSTKKVFGKVAQELGCKVGSEVVCVKTLQQGVDNRVNTFTEKRGVDIELCVLMYQYKGVKVVRFDIVETMEGLGSGSPLGDATDGYGDTLKKAKRNFDYRYKNPYL